MGRKKKTATKAADDNTLVIKRYGNRRLYNTETGTYVNYQDLVKLIRDGHDIQVIDSTSKADVTKSVLIQVILEEEKNDRSLLPTSFLYQLLRSREETAQDFFKNYLSTSFAAYMKTKEEFDKRFRGWLEMGASAPQMWEKFLPGAEMIKDLWGIGKKGEEEASSPASKPPTKPKR
jgi:polyhydroxyalkanoate synthesis repressor PhaR